MLRSKGLSQCLLQVHSKYFRNSLNSVVSSNKPSSTYNNFNSDFEELYQISQNIWNIMTTIIMTDIFPYMMKATYDYNNQISKYKAYVQVKMGRPAKGKCQL